MRLTLILLTALGCASAPSPIATHLDPARVPLIVSSASDVLWAGYAIDSWNQAAGCTVFRRGTDGNVRIELSGLEHSGIAGGTYRRGDSYEILVYRPAQGDAIASYLVIAHELGHVLGLGEGTGIMHPRVAEGRGVLGDGPMPFISPGDARAVRERYCEGAR